MKLFPKFFVLKPKPSDVSDKELAKGQPIYIDGFAQATIDDLVARVEVLEAKVEALEQAG